MLAKLYTCNCNIIQHQLQFQPDTVFIDYETATKNEPCMDCPGVRVKSSFFQFIQFYTREFVYCKPDNRGIRSRLN